jgi:predicted ArsR family transcriptional regulator
MATEDIVRERVKECMAKNLGATTREVADMLNISRTTAWRHMVSVKNEWKKDTGQ